MDKILRERRLGWLGHVMRMDRQCMPQQALYWDTGYKYQDTRGTRSTTNELEEHSQQTSMKDGAHLRVQAEVAALDRQEWHRSVCPSESTWMWVEPRSRSRISCRNAVNEANTTSSSQ